MLCLFLPIVVNFPDIVQASELGGLVGLAGDCALEVRIADVVGEAAGNNFGVGKRDNPTPAVVSVWSFKAGAGEADEGLEVFLGPGARGRELGVCPVHRRSG